MTDAISSAASQQERLDPDRILTSIGEVPYHWQIETDKLIWGDNVRDVLPFEDVAAIGSGRAFAHYVDPKSGPTRSVAVMHSAASDRGDGVQYQLQYALRLPGHTDLLWIEDTGRWFAGPDGKPAQAHGIVRAINERHQREQQLAYLSRCDALTGEMNRARLVETLEATLEEAGKLRSSCGFLLLAIDKLDRINEAYGFDIADEVIAAIAKRLRSQLRGQDHLGRVSGNKFGIILNSCTPDELEIAADRLLTCVRDNVVQTSAGPVAVTVTIGGVTAPRHAHTVHDVLLRGQEALDRCKITRRGSFHAYVPSVERDVRRRANVQATEEIISALNARRICLAYEPVVEIGSRRPVFYECLMRVRQAGGALLAVSEAVPLAEQLGLVRLLDRRVLELVLAELVAAPGLVASINISTATTTDPDWWNVLNAILRGNAGVGERLIVELAGTTVIDDVDDTRGFVARLKDLGCRIAIDDFGAGHTSFRNLRKLDVDLVKIDGSFVQNLWHSSDDRAFVRTIIDLAHRLGLQTVAEWVQDEEAAAMLADWGCDLLQGKLIGLASAETPWRPAPPARRAAPV